MTDLIPLATLTSVFRATAARAFSDPPSAETRHAAKGAGRLSATRISPESYCPSVTQLARHYVGGAAFTA